MSKDLSITSVRSGERDLAESILVGKIAGIFSFAKNLSEKWQLPVVANPQSDHGFIATSKLALKNIKTLVEDLETDIDDFCSENYSRLWEIDEEDSDNY